MPLQVLTIPDAFTTDPGDGTGREDWNAPALEVESYVMVHLTMIIGINEITERNARAFLRRARMWEHAVGGTMFRQVAEGGGVVDMPMTAERVARWRGLRTNASLITDAAYKRKVADTLGDTVDHELGNIARMQAALNLA